LNGDDIRYSSMISRHLFSYSAAYLMSGEEPHLEKAMAIKNYLLQYAWDKVNGGWFDALLPSGDPNEYIKSTFVQVYVITGLTMYYTITHDPEILRYIDKTNDLLELKAWDSKLGGYFDVLSRDWIVNSPVKSCSSQLAPISGYLIYLYLSTHKTKYLHQAERIADTILKYMQDPGSGWILESFDNDWVYQQPGARESEINIGHNIEVAWSLLRLYTLNQRQEYLKSATTLADKIHHYGFNPVTGMWIATVGREKPFMHSDYTYWWIQVYGNMFDLYLNRIYPDQQYLNHFEKGASFWNTYFLDKVNGDTHFSVFEDGAIREDFKANRYKASYHSMEHCLLNFLYLQNWTNNKPLNLFFKLNAAKAGESFYPLAIEMTDLQIKSIQINNKKVQNPIIRDGYITLPDLNHARIEVNMQTPIGKKGSAPDRE
ncbi:MAG: AGE family epimerase/isomerase, partial [Saprospiraceae bacterium]|nr:AGE family epimerase/isomerase [Saprospiraceae bacterium]